MHFKERDAFAAPAVEEASPLKPKSTRLRGTLPPEMVHSILHNKQIVSEYVRHNESLWNSSNISQHVFSERLTKALMDDLVDEVLDEVGELLDDYVEGLVSYELQ